MIKNIKEFLKFTRVKKINIFILGVIATLFITEICLDTLQKLLEFKISIKIILVLACIYIVVISYIDVMKKKSLHEKILKYNYEVFSPDYNPYERDITFTWEYKVNGDEYEIINLTPLCGSCNSKLETISNDKTQMVWYCMNAECDEIESRIDLKGNRVLYDIDYNDIEDYMEKVINLNIARLKLEEYGLDNTNQQEQVHTEEEFIF